MSTSSPSTILFQLFLLTSRLWTDVTNCPSPTPCSCTVQRDDVPTESYAIKFLDDRPSRGSVNVSSLQPDTPYSFTMNCVGATQPASLSIRTDYGRPSVPLNIAVRLVEQRLQVSWLRPATPAGPIHSYRVTIDSNSPFVNLSGDARDFTTTDDYVLGTIRTFFVQACNDNRRNQTECSSATEGRVSFSLPVSTSTPSRITTQSKSSSIFSSFVFLFPFLCSSLVLMQ